MSRARNIKPGFFKNDLLAECSPLARILFIGLWCEADREGRLENRHKRIKADCLPYDECDVSELLGELSKRGFITCYEVNGSHYIAIPEFSKHQNPHCKEQASSIPAPCKHGASTVQASGENSESTEVARLIPDSLLLIPDPLQKIPPADAAGSLPADPKPKAKRPPTITEWLSSLGDADAIPADDPVYAYAEKAGIPDDFLLLSWAEFKSAYAASGKRQKDFPATYRNAVKGNWYKLWWISPEGDYRLTTAGEQAKRAQA